MTEPYRPPRRFELVRIEDETGVSGTGIVASGVMWGDGRVAMRWHPQNGTVHAVSTGFYESIGDVALIHGHMGKTRVEWLDADWGVMTVDRHLSDEEAAEIKRQWAEQQQYGKPDVLPGAADEEQAAYREAVGMPVEDPMTKTQAIRDEVERARIPLAPPPIRSYESTIPRAGERQIDLLESDPWKPSEPDPGWFEKGPRSPLSSTEKLLVGVAVAAVIAMVILAVAYQVRFR